MKLIPKLGLLLLAAAPGSAIASQYEATVTTIPGSYRGVVVEYTPRQTLVLRDPEQRVYRYALGPDVVIPSDLAVGRMVSLRVEPGDHGKGSNVVRQISVTSLDDGSRETTTRTTETLPDGSSVTTTGTVVDFVPQKTLVLRDASDRQVTYALGSDLVLPEGVQIGKTVTVYASEAPAAGGYSRINRVTTTRSIDADGEVQTIRTTEVSAPSQPVTVAIAADRIVTGVVSDFKEKKRVSILRSDGSQVTYALDRRTAVPHDLKDGSRVILRLSRASDPRTVETISYAP